jgi:hypothetical protein
VPWMERNEMFEQVSNLHKVNGLFRKNARDAFE